jgi:hypothetical protein
VLDRFKPSTLNSSESSGSSTSVYSGGDWVKVQSSLDESVEDTHSKEARKISRTLHHLVAQNELLHHEITAIKEALQKKKKRSTRRKVLPLQQHQEYHGGAVFWSPHARREAEKRYEIFQRLAHEEELAKLRRKRFNTVIGFSKKRLWRRSVWRERQPNWCV